MMESNFRWNFFRYGSGTWSPPDEMHESMVLTCSGVPYFGSDAYFIPVIEWKSDTTTLDKNDNKVLVCFKEVPLVGQLYSFCKHRSSECEINLKREPVGYTPAQTSGKLPNQRQAHIPRINEKPNLYNW